MNLALYIPADITSAAIRIAMARAQQDAVGFGTRIDTAKVNRDMLLLGDDPSALKKAEAQLTETRGDAERLEAITHHLQGRLKAALRQEKLDSVEAAKRETSAAADALNGFIAEHGAALASLLDRARQVAQRQTEAAAAHRHIQTEAIRDFVDADDVVGAEQVSTGGAKVTSVAAEADVLLQFIAHASFLTEFVAAFPSSGEPDTRGVTRIWPRRAAR